MSCPGAHIAAITLGALVLLIAVMEFQLWRSRRLHRKCQALLALMDELAREPGP